VRHGLDVVGVDVEDRRTDDPRHVRAVRRRTAEPRLRRETNLFNLLTVRSTFTRPACRVAAAKRLDGDICRSIAAGRGAGSYRLISAARARTQQQTRRPPLQLLIDETDRWTDGRARSLDRFMMLTAYYIGGQRNTTMVHYCGQARRTSSRRSRLRSACTAGQADSSL